MTILYTLTKYEHLTININKYCIYVKSHKYKQNSHKGKIIMRIKQQRRDTALVTDFSEKRQKLTTESRSLGKEEVERKCEKQASLLCLAVYWGQVSRGMSLNGEN